MTLIVFKKIMSHVDVPIMGYCSDGVSSNFLEVMQSLMFFFFFCGVAVFRIPPSPPPFDIVCIP